MLLKVRDSRSNGNDIAFKMIAQSRATRVESNFYAKQPSGTRIIAIKGGYL